MADLERVVVVLALLDPVDANVVQTGRVDKRTKSRVRKGKTSTTSVQMRVWASCSVYFHFYFK